ncbi:conserved hypothetical protein [uncultured Paludibacter sp.]|uniref:Secretion system C-terminal sorting domain-containing protein n=1 Tax=uncultured Paludibacter sp. TaxID=497635 RepID=A0A653ABE3_9BACT|nr:conserved hypothetical protein [uncultured Paludibacter sp.]
MRKILPFLFFGIFIINGFSQSPLRLEPKKYGYRAGDSIYKYQVEYKDPGSKGRQLQWDFSNVKVLNDNYLIKYFYPDKKDTFHICGMEHRTRYYYLQKKDSLWSTGFENYTTLINYTTPELKLKFPFNYGDTLYSAFEGEGIYCNMLKLKVKGWTRVEADAEGELTLPGNKKVKHALRTHTTRYYTETGKDSTEMSYETYTWYGKNLRYPIFESIKTTLHRLSPGRGDGGEVGVKQGSQVSDTIVFHTSFYYTPEELNIQPDLLANDSTDIYGNPIPEAERVFTEARMLPNPVINNLNIDFKLTRRAVIWFSVHNNIGIPMRQTHPQSLDEGYHQTQIPMGGLVTGTYTVYVHVDDRMIQRVVVKK